MNTHTHRLHTHIHTQKASSCDTLEPFIEIKSQTFAIILIGDDTWNTFTFVVMATLNYLSNNEGTPHSPPAPGAQPHRNHQISSK